MGPSVQEGVCVSNQVSDAVDHVVGEGQSHEELGRGPEYRVAGQRLKWRDELSEGCPRHEVANGGSCHSCI